MIKSNVTRWFGLALAIAVLAWDVDAMLPHIAAHSWLTLGYVSIFFVGHALDYLTLGRIIDRLHNSPLYN
jgi:hypothetical protein